MFAPDTAVTFRGRTACGTVKTFIENLEAKGFTVIHNGDDPDAPEISPTPHSLHYTLQSPVPLDELDLEEDTYYLAGGKYTYMCEWHYHFVRLINPDLPT